MKCRYPDGRGGKCKSSTLAGRGQVRLDVCFWVCPRGGKAELFPLPRFFFFGDAFGTPWHAVHVKIRFSFADDALRVKRSASMFWSDSGDPIFKLTCY